MRRVAFAVLSTVAGLVGLLSFKTEATGSTAASSAVVGTTSGSGTTSSSTHTGTANTSSGAATSPSTTRSTSRKSTSSTSAATKTVTGSAVDTPYGPIQVKITVRGGTVVDATVTAFPESDPRSSQINAYAIPYLEKETAGVSSVGSVHMISGATYTSEGYLQSLQSALNKAGL